MRVALSRRLAAAFTAGFPTAAEREFVITAAEDPQVRTFDDLPKEVRSLVARLEA